MKRKTVFNLLLSAVLCVGMLISATMTAGAAEQSANPQGGSIIQSAHKKKRLLRQVAPVI